MDKTKRTKEQVIEAIKGSAGIKATIAQRLEVSRHTVDNYLDRWAIVRQAYENETETVKDVAESVVIHNIRLMQTAQQKGEIVQSGDAKWYLKHKAKDRGYVERQEMTGADGEKLETAVQIYLPSNERDEDN